jgi:hypothetical protein
MSQKNNAQAAQLQHNLLTNEEFLSFINIQVQYGVAQRGGVILCTHDAIHTSRIVSDVNILQAKEIKKLAFENFISKD